MLACAGLSPSAPTLHRRPIRMPTKPSTPSQRKDSERPLLEDIRLLGRILGDVIREHDGVQAFELVE